MAKAVFNSALSISGMVDGFVYRKVRGQVVVSGRPVRDKDAPSAAQTKQRRRFAHANEYAKSVLADPCRRGAYEHLARLLNRRYDRLVASDFLTPPEVEHIELSEYHGQVGDVIRVLAFDDVEVVSVDVALHTAAGALVEKGRAAKEHGVWLYTATAAAPAGETLTITATARDRPGHPGVGSTTYSGASPTEPEVPS